jgi:hypothetical protein
MNQSIALPKLHESRSLYLRRTVPNDAGLLFRQGFCQREFYAAVSAQPQHLRLQPICSDCSRCGSIADRNAQAESVVP